MPNNWQDSHKCVNNILIQDKLGYMTLREEHEVLIQVFENTRLNVTLIWVTILINNLEVPAVILNLATGYSD